MKGKTRIDRDSALSALGPPGRPQAWGADKLARASRNAPTSGGCHRAHTHKNGSNVRVSPTGTGKGKLAEARAPAPGGAPSQKAMSRGPVAAGPGWSHVTKPQVSGSRSPSAHEGGLDRPYSLTRLLQGLAQTPRFWR